MSRFSSSAMTTQLAVTPRGASCLMRCLLCAKQRVDTPNRPHAGVTSQTFRRLRLDGDRSQGEALRAHDLRAVEVQALDEVTEALLALLRPHRRHRDLLGVRRGH